MYITYQFTHQKNRNNKKMYQRIIRNINKRRKKQTKKIKNQTKQQLLHLAKK